MTARHLAVLIAAVMLLMVPAIVESSEDTDAQDVTNLGMLVSDNNNSTPTSAYDGVSIVKNNPAPETVDEIIYVLVGSTIKINLSSAYSVVSSHFNTVPGLDVSNFSIEGTATGAGTAMIYGTYFEGEYYSRYIIQVVEPIISDYTTGLGTWSGGTNTSTSTSAYSSVSYSGTSLPNAGLIYIQQGATVNFSIDGSMASFPTAFGSIPGLSVSTGGLLDRYIEIGGTVSGWGDITVVFGDYNLNFRVVGGDAPPSTYTLQYNVGEGSGSFTTQTYGPTTDTSHTFNISGNSPTPPHYHHFEGWSTTPGGNVEYSPSDSITVSIDDPTVTLYAVYEPISFTYRLIFNLQGGESNGLPGYLSYGPTTSTSHTFDIPSTEPTLSGHTFLGWALYPDDGAIYDPGDDIKLNALPTQIVSFVDQTLYAVWSETPSNTFYLYFDVGGGSGGPSTQTSEPTAGSSYQFTIPMTEPTWSGHNFLGWDINESADTVYYDPGDTITVYYEDGSTSTTLYAVWSGSYTYRITFYANGGTGAPSMLSYGPTADESHTFTLPMDEPTRSGYDFTGWGTSVSGGDIYQPGGQITLHAEGEPFVNQTLYAQWVAVYTYTLNFNANGGSGAPDPQTYGPTQETTHTFTISSQEPTLANSTFMGWSTASTGSVEYQPGDEITLASLNYSITLYAIWTTNLAFTITYNANGGSGAPDPQTYSSGTETEHTFIITSDEPTREGWVFMGWARDPDSVVAYYHGGEEYTVYSSNPQITMYAVWSTYVTFTITFDANGGSGAPDVMTYGPTLDPTHQFIIPDDVPSYQYREFLGWATSSSSMTEFEPGDTITLNRDDIDVTLYAVWGDIVTPGGVSITISGSTTASVGETRTLTAVVLPSDLTDRSVSWTITAGEGLIDYQIEQTWRGSTFTYEATGAGTVTIRASAVADSDAVDIITITIGQATSDDSEVIGPQGIVGALGAALFGGSSSIAGVVLFAIILAVLFAIIREPLPVVLLGIPVLAIFTLLGILDMDMVILLIIVVTVGLALIARKMWRD